MKKLKTLRTSWFLLAMALAVVVGELMGRIIAEMTGLRVPVVPVAALSIGLCAFIVSLIYDGTD